MKILITDKVHETGINQMKEFAEVEIATELSQKELLEKIHVADALVVRSGTNVTKEVLEKAENLKLIVRAGVGLDNINLEATEEKNIKVLNTPEASVNPVAELTIGLMLAWSRNLGMAYKSMKEEKWIKSQLKGSEIDDKTLGVIGTGKIGIAVARKANSLGMKIVGYNRTKYDDFTEAGGEYIGLNEVLKKSDYVTIHLPLTEKTKRTIGEKELKMMKPTAVLINTARGAIVDEKALTKALKEKEIAGACVDVYSKEPPEDYTLPKLDNVFPTPHLGASTKEAQEKLSILVAQKIKEELM